MSGAPGVGDPVPEFTFTSISGQVHSLSELWAEGPALILWLRHFG